MTRRIDTLSPGQEFTARGRKGTLLRVTPSAAHVEIEVNEERVFTTAEGKQVRITKSRERTHWSLATEVEV